MSSEKRKPKISFQEYAHFLKRYLKPRILLVISLGIALFFGICLQLINPLILRNFIDLAQAGGAVDLLIRMALIFIAIAVTQQLIGVLVVYLTEMLGWSTTNQLRLELARHTLGLDMSFHSGHTPGEMIERIDGDVMALSNFFSQFIIQVFGNTILVLGILAVLFWTNWLIGVTLTAFVIITFIVLLRLANIAVGPWELERQASANLFGFLEERLSGTEDIRSNNAIYYVLDRFYRLTRELMQRTIKAGLKLNILLNTTWILFAISNSIALVVSAFLYQNGSITMGTVYMTVYYTNMINWPLERITQQMQDLQRAGASLIRIMDIQKIKSRIPGEGDYSQPVQKQLHPGPLSVVFDSVTFSYQDYVAPNLVGDKTSLNQIPSARDLTPDNLLGVPFSENENSQTDLVLKDISFTLAPGRVLGLLGRTGSGKTTLTRLLFRLYDPDQGQILLMEKNEQNNDHYPIDIRELSLLELRQSVGMVTQNIQLFHASVRENLTFFNERIPDERILEAIRDLGLWDWYLSLGKGLDTELESGGGGLSAGEAQLLAFTRIFLRDPGLIILDEATSRLDPATESLIERAVDKLVKNRTAIIVAHRLGTVQRADDILILEDGMVFEYGERLDLANNPGSRFKHLLQTGLEEVMV